MIKRSRAQSSAWIVHGRCDRRSVFVADSIEARAIVGARENMLVHACQANDLERHRAKWDELVSVTPQEPTGCVSRTNRFPALAAPFSDAPCSRPRQRASEDCRARLGHRTAGPRSSSSANRSPQERPSEQVRPRIELQQGCRVCRWKSKSSSHRRDKRARDSTSPRLGAPRGRTPSNTDTESETDANPTKRHSNQPARCGLLRPGNSS